MRPSLHYLLTGILVVSLLVGPVAGSTALMSQEVSTDVPDNPRPAAATAAMNHSSTGSNASADGNGTVTVGVGQQLSTIISTTSDDTQTGFENFAFEVSFQTGNETARAEAVADRAEELRERVAAIRAEYRSATEAFAAGNLTRSQYAHRLASLNARAENVLSSLQSLRDRSRNVSELELRVAGVNRTQLRKASEDLSNVTGTGPSALLQRFLGTSTGTIELETSDGLSIEVEGEAGERSREVRRARDTDFNISVDGATALATARSALSNQSVQWALRKSSVHPAEGYYKFEFGFRSANETGEAEVRVDGSTGEVFRLEEEIESVDDSATEPDEAIEDQPDDLENETDDLGNERDRDRDEDEIDDLAVVLASGTPEPGATIDVRVLANGVARENATVRLNGDPVGTTDADGRISLTLPAAKAKITAHVGDETGELEFEFEEDDDTVFRNLNVSVAIDNRSAIVLVMFNGSPVQDVKVYANDDLKGTTPKDGSVSFTIPSGVEELELEVLKGEFEAELTYELTDGQVNRTEDPHQGDGDKIEDEGEDDDADEDEEDREDDDDEEETDTPEPEEDDDDEEETDTPEPEDEDSSGSTN